jgi:hypothetical protein
MSIGFSNQGKKNEIDNNVKISIDLDNIDVLLKEYKKIKKYQKSSLYVIKTIDGTEQIVSSLIREAEKNPL